MGQMKGARRIVVFALGIICIILVVGLLISIADYTTINSLNRQISSLNSQITNLQNIITSLNETLTNLNDTVNLAKTKILVSTTIVSQPANHYYYWNITAKYAGYISVNVQSSTNNTYVEAVYSAYGVDYDNLKFVGTSGTMVFPILPANFQVRVGNTNLASGANETVAIVYHY